MIVDLRLLLLQMTTAKHWQGHLMHRSECFPCIYASIGLSIGGDRHWLRAVQRLSYSMGAFFLLLSCSSFPMIYVVRTVNSILSIPVHLGSRAFCVRTERPRPFVLGCFATHAALRISTSALQVPLSSPSLDIRLPTNDQRRLQLTAPVVL